MNDTPPGRWTATTGTVTITTTRDTAQLMLDTLDHERQTTLNQLQSAVLDDRLDQARDLAQKAQDLTTARAAVYRSLNKD